MHQEEIYDINRRIVEFENALFIDYSSKGMEETIGNAIKQVYAHLKIQDNTLPLAHHIGSQEVSRFFEILDAIVAEFTKCTMFSVYTGKFSEDLSRVNYLNTEPKLLAASISQLTHSETLRPAKQFVDSLASMLDILELTQIKRILTVLVVLYRLELFFYMSTLSSYLFLGMTIKMG